MKRTTSRFRAVFSAFLALVLSLFAFSSVTFAEPIEDQVAESKGEAVLEEQSMDASAAASEQNPGVSGMQPRAKAPEEQSAVSKTDLSSAKVATQGMMRHEFSGKQLAPRVTLQIGGKTLVEGKDYRLRFGSSVEVPTTAGTYEVWAEAIEGSDYSNKVKVGDYQLIEAPMKEGVAYTVSPVANSDLVLDASGAKPNVGSNITAWSRNNGNNQQWYFVPGDDGYYTIVSAANQALVLDAAGKTPRVGSNVSVWSGNSGLNQRWIIDQQGDGSFIIRNAANENFVLDASGKAPCRGANVTVWSDNEGNNQRWTIKSMNDIYAELDSLAANNRAAIADGSYVIYASGISGHPVVDVKSAVTNAGANVQTGISNSAASQVWEISHDGDYVSIKNKKSGMYLSVANDNSLSGANVVLGANSNARGAKWIFIKDSDGAYSVRSALYTNIALDVTGGKSASGTNIETWTANSTAAQKFSVVSTPANVNRCDNIINTDDYYFIKSFKNGKLQLDVTGASTKNNANIELWNVNKAPWQIFRFEYADGYYRIINVHTNKVLTVQDNSLVPGANVVNYDASGNSANQLWQAKRNDDGSYSFINKQNGFALQVGSPDQKAGTNINSSVYSASNDDQKFGLERLTYLMPTGLYNLKSVLNSSQLLDVTASSTANNANIEMWANNNGANQKWNIQVVDGKENVYTLQAVCSGKYLADNGAGNAVQVSSSDSANSQWKASIVGGSYLLTNEGTGKVLDVTNSKAASGTNVGTKGYTGEANQRWNLAETAPLSNGTYIIRSKVNSSKVIDIAGKSTGNNANVDMWKYNGGGNQKFNITRNSDGTYTIVNCTSGKALDAAKGASSAGTNVIQYSKNGGQNQRWKIVFTNDGGFKFVSAVNPSVVMAFNGSSPADGSNVCLVKDTGAASQHFTFEKTTPPLPSHQSGMLNKAQGYSSGTGYLILVDRAAHKVGIFRGFKGNWSYQSYFSCVTGAPGSPTITGTYRTTGFKRMTLSTDSRARWCTQISGGYFFHTILASNNELGHSLSHGCVRLGVPNAQWIYNNIGRGTTVVLYN